MLEAMSNRTPAERVMNRRRLELGMRWKDVLSAADNMAAETLRRVRMHGTDSVDQLSVARIERALKMDTGELSRMESQESEVVDPLTTSGPTWDGEISGEGPLEEGEELRWRDRAEGGRLYQYRAEGFEHTATLDTGTPPEEAVLLLRAQLAKRIHRMSGVLMDRPQKSPREV